MRWEDERYVRVYTRDTADWLALSWEARAVFLFALRKCDRAGILPVGKSGMRGLAGLLGMPAEVVARAVPELTGDGCLREAEASYIIPNFLEAQESRSSDAQRKRDQRERDRARVLAQGIPASRSAQDKLAAMDRADSVTLRDEKSPAVTTGVTSGHHASPAVTPSRAVPSRADDLPRAPPAGPAPLVLEEQRQTRTRKPSRQQVLYSALVAHRAEVLGPEALPDEPWTIQRQNEALGGPILDCELGLLLAALRRFLESDFAGRCNPPGPLGVFVKQWSRWVSDAMRSNQVGAQ